MNKMLVVLAFFSNSRTVITKPFSTVGTFLKEKFQLAANSHSSTPWVYVDFLGPVDFASGSKINYNGWHGDLTFAGGGCFFAELNCSGGAFTITNKPMTLSFANTLATTLTMNFNVASNHVDAITPKNRAQTVNFGADWALYEGNTEHEFNMAERMRREGWTTDYRELGGDTKNFLPLGINPWYKWGSPAGQRAWTQLLEMPETQELIAKSYGIYAAYMLSEGNLYHNVPDVKWWWRGHSALCRYQRPAGKLAYLRERQMCSQHCPNSIVIAGIDCNPYTGQAEECRRFAAEFYRGKVNLE